MKNLENLQSGNQLTN